MHFKLNHILHILHIKTGLQVVFNVLLSVIVGFFTHVFDIVVESKDAIHSIVLVLLIDWLIGMYKAITTIDAKTGKSLFRTNKSFKILGYFFAYISLIVLTSSVEKNFNYASWITEAVMIPIIVGQIVSIAKNLSIIGFITNKTLSDILNKIDGYKDEEVEAAINSESKN